MTAQRDAAVRSALEDAWMAFPDGAPVAWLERKTGAHDSERIAGANLMTRVLDLGREAGLRHYLFGSTAEVLAALSDRLAQQFAGAKVVGSESPPFRPVESLEPSQDLAAAQPDVVWCSLGAPKQELWMNRFADSVKPAVVVAVGAAFDFLAGTKPRAPLWMQEAGLEWLHRFASEPGRLGGRYVRSNSEFLARAFLTLSKGRL